MLREIILNKKVNINITRTVDANINVLKPYSVLLVNSDENFIFTD